MFKIGQKVVCIDDSFQASINVDNVMGIFNTYPKKDETYTVRGHKNGGIYLEEIKNFPALYSDGFGERSFRTDKFIALDDIEEVSEAVAELSEVLKMVV